MYCFQSLSDLVLHLFIIETTVVMTTQTSHCSAVTEQPSQSALHADFCHHAVKYTIS